MVKTATALSMYDFTTSTLTPNSILLWWYNSGNLYLIATSKQISH